MLIQGTPYVATYSNADGAFYLRGFYALPYAIPIGGLLPYVGASAPNSSFALPFGQAISRTTYATLFGLISTTFGAGDGTTTFNLPDLRGRAVFGLDNMGGAAASRITVAGGNFNGTTLGAAGGAENHSLTQTEMPSHTHTFTGSPLPAHSHGPTSGTNFIADSGGAGFGASGSIGTAGMTSVSAGTPSGTNSNTGGGGAHTVLNPCMVLPFILRVI
jgi:microcystin-dependent protein